MSRSSTKLRPVVQRRKRDVVIPLVACLLLASSLSSSSWVAKAASDFNKDSCPVECACLGNLVACNDLRLIEAPSGLPPWMEVLELKNNNIANLEFDSLLHVPELKKLDVSVNKLGDNFTIALSEVTQLRELKVNKNQLTKVPDLVFVKNITHLTLSHNLITSINGTALLTLQQLQYLDLSGNKISVLQKGSFLTPNQLTHLNLNMNQISIIENGSLDNLTSLEELRLNKNHLTQLKDLFSGLKELRVLEVNRNNLQQIHGLSLKHLTKLRELHLKRNKIEMLDDGAFWPLNNLIMLHLDFNMLTSIRKGGLFGLTSLQTLTLSHNQISSIELQAWEQCLKITEIDLSHNALTSIDRDAFEYLSRLEKLKLSHNQITHIAEGAFNHTTNLRVLELNFNMISYMVEDIGRSFAALGQLWKLNLANNDIKSINQNAFIGLSHVTDLDLIGNNITSIQENALLPMTSLETLKMHTQSLLCDCGLKWLGMWLQKHHYREAKMYCGYPHWLQEMPLNILHHANFTCDEFPKPRIIEEPIGQMSIKGGNVTLICRATSTSDAPLSFTWKHDNVELKSAQFSTETNSSSESGVTEATSFLYLVNVTHANAGKYQCMVTNTFGTTYSGKAKLVVSVYPTFSKIPHDIKAHVGSTARLECAAEGQPSPQIAWQKDGGKVDFPAARERRMHMMPTDDVLFIINVKTRDSGVYSCIAQNLAGSIVANATLTILETPYFVKPMKNKEITVGGSIVLECMANGTPRPKLSWRKNGNPLQLTNRHFFTADNQLLIIVNAIFTDAGNYECEMSNSLGTVVGSSHLTVNPAPNAALNDAEILGVIIISVVCCAIITSVIWVIVIYKTRRRLNSAQDVSLVQPATTVILAVPDNTQERLYLDTSSQHSKDSGTGDSANPSNDQLQLCIPEEAASNSVNNHEEEMGTINADDPLLRYTNHERNTNVDSAV
ncbi:leucine-rich repeats and immunoglobulin-like domains protein 3 isoform X2 [Pseudomyrmex gracilis]|uniref:leucine-rich repeats and immunoglobulin-like domains protein 3 isoform X2 n=1 Tax=Pseudomyrmex gracilis TaxID=219809 RepID=UPI000994E139|nr:leucine-rich repeats and immunoglobulin-like domains protein 3 isoform X2 [Pseudomyrmex gracilis]